MATLFGGAAPSGAQFTDGSPGIKVGLTFNFDTTGQVSELWWYCGANVGGTWTLTMWDITAGDSGSAGTGTQLASQAFVGTPTANAWNKVTLGSPVSVAAGDKRYRVAVHNTQYYWAFNGFFLLHDEVSGDISALRDNDTTSTLGAINQGTFALGSSTTSYPTQTGDRALYPVDVTFASDASTLSGTATIGSASALSASGAIVLSGTATAGGVSALNAAGLVTLAGTATLGGASALSASGLVGSAVDIGSFVTLSATGEVSGGIVETPAGWETIRGAINEARAQHLKHQERRRHPIDCPVHLWPLEIVGNVYHCKFGGHTVRLPAPSP
jgi:hypothetical protein